MTEDDLDGFLDAVGEESRFTRPRSEGALPLDPLDQPTEQRTSQNRFQSGLNPDHQLGVILEGPDGKEQYSPVYEPDPDGDKKRFELQIRPLESFGESELMQIMDNPGLISLFLCNLPEDAPLAFQVECEALNGHILMIVQGGQAWEGDSAWSKFFKSYTGEPLFSRGGTIRDSDQAPQEYKFYKDSALRAVRAITRYYTP